MTSSIDEQIDKSDEQRVMRSVGPAGLMSRHDVFEEQVLMNREDWEECCNNVIESDEQMTSNINEQQVDDNQRLASSLQEESCTWGLDSSNLSYLELRKPGWVLLLELVLFLLVGVDGNREDCCLPSTINKDPNSIYSCVCFDVMLCSWLMLNLIMQLMT